MVRLDRVINNVFTKQTTQLMRQTTQSHFLPRIISYICEPLVTKHILKDQTISLNAEEAESLERAVEVANVRNAAAAFEATDPPQQEVTTTA